MDAATMLATVADLRGQPLANERGEPGWRCIGLVREALHRSGLDVGESAGTVTSAQLKAALRPVKGEPKVGDIGFWNPGGDPDRQNVCGIITAENMMLSVQSGQGVAEYPCDTSWHKLHLLGYWRIPQGG